MFIPDDKRLRTFAATIAEQRRHSLRRLERDDDDVFGRREPGDEPADPAADPAAVEEDGQLSLFTALSAVPLDNQGRRLETARIYDDPIPDYAGGADDVGASSTVAVAAPPVPLPEPELAVAPTGAGASQRQSALARRRQLRDANAAAVADLVHLTGRSHAELNAELNRRVGIRRITEASVRQLELRHQAAVKMMTARRPS